jgi:flagellar hook-associated protein 1
MGTVVSINSILNTGVRGMTASQLGTSVASNNVSNAATVGYTRREANILPDQALVRSNGGSRVVEPFIQKRLLNSQSSSGEASAQRVAVDVLDSVFSEGDGSIGSALDAFQVSMQSLASSPQDSATRQQVLSNGQALSNAFQNASAQIDSARTDAASRATMGVSEVNQRLHQIADIGKEIQAAEGNGAEASDLRDQRDLLIAEVAERVPVQVMEHGNGRISLSLGGAHQMVSPEGDVSELVAKASDNGSIRIEKKVAGMMVDVSDTMTSGSIGGQIKASTGPLAEAKQKLDQLAFDVASSYNQVHTEGVGLDGVGGRELFSPAGTVVDAAKNFSVASGMSADKIAAATEAGTLPSDNRNALKLAGLAAAPIAFGGQTVTEALASLVGFAGGVVQNASQSETFATGALEQVQSIRDNVSGVSSDEEMVQIMKYQRAYQASLKVIQVADEMYADLLRLRG